MNYYEVSIFANSTKLTKAGKSLLPVRKMKFSCSTTDNSDIEKCLLDQLNIIPVSLRDAISDYFIHSCHIMMVKNTNSGDTFWTAILPTVRPLPDKYYKTNLGKNISLELIPELLMSVKELRKCIDNLDSDVIDYLTISLTMANKSKLLKEFKKAASFAKSIGAFDFDKKWEFSSSPDYESLTAFQKAVHSKFPYSLSGISFEKLYQLRGNEILSEDLEEEYFQYTEEHGNEMTQLEIESSLILSKVKLYMEMA